MKKPMIEETVSTREVLRGSSFSFMSDNVMLPNGRTVQRNYVRYPHAVVIIPFIDEKRLILIEQFRYSVGEVIWELPAGKIDDPSEPREAAAYRELLEETGYSAGNMEYLFSYYPAVGYSSEVIHAFRATQLEKAEQQPDEDEIIEPAIVDYSEAMEWVYSGKIKDSKTILLLLYLQRWYRP
jgi:ADP-ribose pyrophosphatase